MSRGHEGRLSELFSVVLCSTKVVHSETHTLMSIWFMFRFSLDLDSLFVCFCHFVPVLFAFVLLGLVFFSTKPRDRLGRTSRKQDPYCVE